MELCLIVLIVCVSNVACAMIGTRAGRGTGEVKLNPVEKVKERRENKALSQEQKQRQEALKTMLHNIDVYDGTEVGQQDVRF